MNNMKYDYLVVGAGLFGATFAQMANKAGKKVLVIDKRDHIGGNIYTEEIEGIQVHKYGAHIFHTNSRRAWEYITQFAEFNRYTNSPVANYHGELYSLPFNMLTFNKMWGVITPDEAKAKIAEQDEIIKDAEKLFRQVMNIPDNYKVLFLQGGASQQFAMIPMNLMKNGVADYIITGVWAKKAWQEAQMYGKANAIASSADETFSYIPDCSDLPISEDADYVYICENNTIYGTKFHTLPNTKGKVLVSDVSSCFLSEPVDVTKYGMIYGGVQKNIGPAGVVIAIIREDLIREDVLPGTPTMLRYKTHADNGSMYNTPPAYGIYICGKVFKWLKKMGGLEAMKAVNEKKAKVLYDFLDSSKLFKGTVRKEDRSLMNVPFVTGNEELDAEFVKAATAAGFVNLKGHRSVGGMRASIYNAMPYAGVEALIAFMKDFEKVCGVSLFLHEQRKYFLCYRLRRWRDFR